MIFAGDNSRAPALCLLGVLALALWLRVAGISFRMYQDETTQVFQAMSVGRLQFRDVDNGIYPFLLCAVYGAAYLGGKFAGIFSSMDDFLALYLEQMYPMFLIARVAEAAAGTACVALLYLLGRKMWNHRVGLFAAFLMALSYVDVYSSQNARGQAFATLFTIASFICIIDICERGRWRDYLLAGIWGGLAASIRIMAFYLVIPMLVAHFAGKAGRSGLRSKAVSLVRPAFGALAMFVVHGLANPQNWYQPGRMLKHMINVLAFLGIVSRKKVLIGSYKVSADYYLTSGLIEAYGYVVLGVIACGVIWSLIKIKDRKFWFILSSAIPYVAVMSQASIASFRYLFPISYLLLLLGGVAVVEICEQIAKRRIRASIVYLALVVLIGVQPYRYVQGKNMLMTAPRTQVASAEWIFANIPEGSVVAADSMGEQGPDLKRFPVIDYWIFNLSREELGRLYRERMAGDAGGSYILRYFMDHPPSPKYRLINMGTRETIDVDALVGGGVEYVVTSSRVRELVTADNVQRGSPDIYGSRRKLYGWLDEEGTRIKSFSPRDGLSGPTIDIYKMH